MQAGSNEIGKEGELAIGGGASSIRKKFLKGKVRKLNFNLFRSKDLVFLGKEKSQWNQLKKLLLLKKK